MYLLSLNETWIVHFLSQKNLIQTKKRNTKLIVMEKPWSILWQLVKLKKATMRTTDKDLNVILHLVGYFNNRCNDL